MGSHKEAQCYRFPYTKESLTRALNKLNHILELKKYNGYCVLPQDSHVPGKSRYALTSILEHELEE